MFVSAHGIETLTGVHIRWRDDDDGIRLDGVHCFIKASEARFLTQAGLFASSGEFLVIYIDEGDRLEIVAVRYLAQRPGTTAADAQVNGANRHRIPNLLLKEGSET
jgi:hypothetical protein